MLRGLVKAPWFVLNGFTATIGARKGAEGLECVHPTTTTSYKSRKSRTRQKDSRSGPLDRQLESTLNLLPCSSSMSRQLAGIKKNINTVKGETLSTTKKLSRLLDEVPNWEQNEKGAPAENYGQSDVECCRGEQTQYWNTAALGIRNSAPSSSQTIHLGTARRSTCRIWK